MHKKNNSANLNIYQLFFDTLFIAVSFVLSSYIYKFIKGSLLYNEHIWMFFVFWVIFVFVMSVYHMYDLTTFYYLDRIFIRSTVSVTIAGLCLSTIVFLLKIDSTSRLMFLFFCTISCILVLAERFLIRFIYEKNIVKRNTKVMFIGNQKTYEKFKKFTEKTFLSHEFFSQYKPSDPIVRDVEKFEEHIKNNCINDVVIVFDGAEKFNYHSHMQICEDIGISVRIVLDFIDLPISNRFISSIGTYPTITYHCVSMDKIQMFLKQVVDFIFAFLGLVITFPIFIIVAIAIKIESSGPIFFKQKRAGINGKVFEIYKFRSMHVDAEEKKEKLMKYNTIKGDLMFKIEEDPRVTKVGRFLRKTSIDELPQFINILQGHMSLVGTRPPTLDEVEKYTNIQRRRISMKPGITGMWQVSGRSKILDFDEVVKLDWEYINNWSIILDFRIIIKTIFVVLNQKGAT